MGNGILNNQSARPVRMRQSHPKTDWAAIILHVECVLRKAQSLREMIHDRGNAIESIGELLGLWRITVAEARVVGCNQMVPVGQAIEERLNHPRRRRKPVKQQQGWRVFWARFPVENRQSLDLYSPIACGLFHSERVFLPV